MSDRPPPLAEQGPTEPAPKAPQTRGIRAGKAAQRKRKVFIRWSLELNPDLSEDQVYIVHADKHGYSVGMDRVCGNVIMVATWMLCRNRWSLWERYQGCHMDALREWMKSDLDVITVGKSPFGKKALLPPPPPRPSTSEFVGRARVFLA